MLNIHWKDWCWSSNTLATLCEKLTHLKRPCCWERLKAGGERDNRGWDGWVVSPTQWTWVWAKSGDGEGQGSLACCSPRSHTEFDMTEWLNNNNSRCHLSILPVALPNRWDLSRSSLQTHFWLHGFCYCHSGDTPLNHLAVTSWTRIYRPHRTETNRETLFNCAQHRGGLKCPSLSFSLEEVYLHNAKSSVRESDF